METAGAKNPAVFSSGAHGHTNAYPKERDEGRCAHASGDFDETVGATYAERSADDVTGRAGAGGISARASDGSEKYSFGGVEKLDSRIAVRLPCSCILYARRTESGSRAAVG